MKLLRAKKFIIYNLTFIILFSGCYSFKSGRIPENIKTVNIQYFPNRAAIVQPSLSQYFTDKMKDKFVSESRLTLVQKEADLTFEGYISDYNNSPSAIQSNEQAALNRLTITISLKFTNAIDPKQDFETTFSRFAEYSSSQNFTSVETGLIQDITKQLIDDIYNKSVSNW
ncbi:MAG: LptE family protein [Bacteroidia bacterium]